MARQVESNPSGGDIVKVMLVVIGTMWIVSKIKSPEEVVAGSLGAAAGKVGELLNPPPTFGTKEQVQLGNTDWTAQLGGGSGMNLTWRFNHMGPATTYIAGAEFYAPMQGPTSWIPFFGSLGTAFQRIEREISVDNDPSFYSYEVSASEAFQGHNGVFNMRIYIRRGNDIIVSWDRRSAVVAVG